LSIAPRFALNFDWRIVSGLTDNLTYAGLIFVPYEPQFTIRARLLSQVEQVAELRKRPNATAVEFSRIPALAAMNKKVLHQAFTGEL
jgi:hypothetical protein